MYIVSIFAVYIITLCKKRQLWAHTIYWKNILFVIGLFYCVKCGSVAGLYSVHCSTCLSLCQYHSLLMTFFFLSLMVLEVCQSIWGEQYWVLKSVTMVFPFLASFHCLGRLAQYSSHEGRPPCLVSRLTREAFSVLLLTMMLTVAFS